MLRLLRSHGTNESSPDDAIVLRVPIPTETDAATVETPKSSSHIDAPVCPKGLVLMCGQMGSLSRDLSDWAERMRAVVMVVSENNMTLDWLRKYAPKLDFLLVDADYLGDAESTIDFCLQVRRATPTLPLVLVSSEIRSHDFTCERMMACDVTLKLPLLHNALTLGVQAAYQNNEYYQSTR